LGQRFSAGELELTVPMYLFLLLQSQHLPTSPVQQVHHNMQRILVNKKQIALFSLV